MLVLGQLAWYHGNNVSAIYEYVHFCDFQTMEAEDKQIKEAAKLESQERYWQASSTHHLL